MQEACNTYLSTISILSQRPVSCKLHRVCLCGNNDDIRKAVSNGGDWSGTQSTSIATTTTQPIATSTPKVHQTMLMLMIVLMTTTIPVITKMMILIMMTKINNDKGNTNSGDDSGDAGGWNWAFPKIPEEEAHCK